MTLLPTNVNESICTAIKQPFVNENLEIFVLYRCYKIQIQHLGQIFQIKSVINLKISQSQGPKLLTYFYKCCLWLLFLRGHRPFNALQDSENSALIHQDLLQYGNLDAIADLTV